MSQRFCTSCQAVRDADTGEMRKCRRTARWVCQMCITREAKSIYRNQSGHSVDVAKLMEKLYRKAAL